ncbi:hypothetical protein FFLO_02254 [Filobasidium floriforme]|uniref:Galactose-binding like protein n=1 Tax=Filobasidium floriforme TaxID=5210 RepID=A0A8K0JN77_9TREE|nr:hypothetical protein FFLO_02254 [Filobasidium floriforme]
MAPRNITPKDTVVTVSSTFDKSSNKKNLLDGNEETCWSSQQGLPQSISLKVSKLTPITHIALTFQGGFSGTTCSVYLASDRPGKASEGVDLGLIFGGKIYPKDSNGLAPSSLPIPEALPDTFHENGIHIDSETNQTTAEKDWIKEVKLEFEKSADPWGRIVVYGVELLSDYTGEF